jgi:hypothetical protein
MSLDSMFIINKLRQIATDNRRMKLEFDTLLAQIPEDQRDAVSKEFDDTKEVITTATNTMRNSKAELAILVEKLHSGCGEDVLKATLESACRQANNVLAANKCVSDALARCEYLVELHRESSGGPPGR